MGLKFTAMIRLDFGPDFTQLANPPNEYYQP